MDDECYIGLAVLVFLEIFTIFASILLCRQQCQKNPRSRQYRASSMYDQEQQAPLLRNQYQEHEIYGQQQERKRFDVLQQTEEYKNRICDLEDELRRERDQNEILNRKLQKEIQEKDETLKRFDVLQQTEEECKRQICNLEDELRRESDQNEILNGKLQMETQEKDEALKKFDVLQQTEEECKRRICDLEDELRRENERLNRKLKKETEEKDDALKRLSALMSNRLRDGNPDVVDLSDQNRPLKVGEQFSELYDNLWTDAFTALQEQFQDKTERDFIELLLKIVEKCYEICTQATQKEMTQLKHDIDGICASVTHGGSKLGDDLMQRIKEERKLVAANRIPDEKQVIQLLKDSFASCIATDEECSGREPVCIYVRECLRLCHLIVNQDPPMMIKARPDPSNSDNFKAYQTRGKQIFYVVWPVLFLHEGGPLVSKGVAEFGI